MDQELKQRLIGASVIIALAIIFVPMLFDGDGVKQQNQNISIEIPETPNDLEVKTFDIDRPVTDQQLNLPDSDVSLTQQNTAAETEPPVIQPQLIDKKADEQLAEEAAEVANEQANENLTNKSVVDVKEVSSQGEVDNSEAATAEVKAEEAPKEAPVKQAVAKEKPINKAATVQTIDLAYRVKLGSFSKQANAQKVKTQLLQKKINSMVEKDATRALYHVWSAEMYQSKAKAEQYVKAVNALKLNIGQPTVQSMNAAQVDALAQQGQLGWVVQLGSFSTKDNAIELRNKVKAAGFSGFVDRIKNSRGENRFRLRVGPLMEKKDATKAQADINSRLKITGLIKAHEPGLPVES